MKLSRLLLAIAIATGVPALLGACSRKASQRDSSEAEARERYAARMFHDIDAGRAWGVSSRRDVQFEEGFSPIMFDPPAQELRPSFYNHAFRWMGQHAHVRLKPHDHKRMKLTVGGWAHENVLRTHPVVQLYVDGYHLATSPLLPAEGHYYFEQEVPDWMLQREWVDLIIKTNTVSYHWADPPSLSVLILYRFDWQEIAEPSAK